MQSIQDTQDSDSLPKEISSPKINAPLLSFSIIRQFLSNPDRILPALTYNGYNPLNVNAGRILP